MKIAIRNGLFFRQSEVENPKYSIWFIHGFGDSSLAYYEAFGTSLAKENSLFAPDMPGFGVTPLIPGHSSISSHADLLATEIYNWCIKYGRKAVIIAHSIGGLIGTRICQQLEDYVHYYFNIEGNLTSSDAYFSSKPLLYENPGTFYLDFEREIFEKSRDEKSYRRYYGSVRFADPEGMYLWAKSSQESMRDNKCGYEFALLNCKKLYIWGDKDTPDETATFIQEENIPDKLYKGVGHWHMVENCHNFYNDLHLRIHEYAN